MKTAREIFSEKVLPEFAKKYVKNGDLVVDIGKPPKAFHYERHFTQANYKTLDRMASKNPDILDDLENTKLHKNSFDIIIAHGLWAQCDNPFKLIEGCYDILKHGGYALFGIISVMFPMSGSLDLIRFTPSGVRKLLKKFEIISFYVLKVGEIPLPSYIYVVARKTTQRECSANAN